MKNGPSCTAVLRRNPGQLILALKMQLRICISSVTANLRRGDVVKTLM